MLSFWDGVDSRSTEDDQQSSKELPSDVTSVSVAMMNVTITESIVLLTPLDDYMNDRFIFFFFFFFF